MDPKQLEAIERWNLVFGALLIAAAAIIFGPGGPMFVGILVGVILACANFWGMHRMIRASFRAKGQQRMMIQMLLILKMGILFLLIFLAMKLLPLSPVGLAIGLSVFLVSIVVESVRFALGVSNGRA